MDTMDFNKCIENIQVYTNYLMAPVFPALNCEGGVGGRTRWLVEEMEACKKV